jgi:WD40 repeat protein
VLSVAVHPSGSAFVTGSSDSKVRLFDLQQRQCTQTVAEHSDQVLPQLSAYIKRAG